MRKKKEIKELYEKYKEIVRMSRDGTTRAIRDSYVAMMDGALADIKAHFDSDKEAMDHLIMKSPGSTIENIFSHESISDKMDAFLDTY